MNTQTVESAESVPASQATNSFVRLFGWMMLAFMLVFITNNFLNYGAGLPGVEATLVGNGSVLGWLQVALYPLMLLVAALFVLRTPERSLRKDSHVVSEINAMFIRCAFWAVLIIGIGDALVSFLRIENLLPGIVGDEITRELGKPEFRGIYFHMPLMALGIIIGFFTRTLGFTWLTLLIVLAELMIVFSRFIFSYEQALMADLVRFWYGALFLFASAFTLLEDGHVRVDVFYAGFTQKNKGLVNALGSILLGMSLCWTILIVGMSGQFAIINAPVFSFEVTQSSFGMYVKYMMAGFLGVFAISMMIQFVSYMMDAVADYQGAPAEADADAPTQN